MKQVYSYNELKPLFESGKIIKFTYPLQAIVTAARKQENGSAHVTVVLLVGEYAIADLQTEYESIEGLLEAFDITNQQEIFELLT
jgi:hypothetical protein